MPLTLEVPVFSAAAARAAVAHGATRLEINRAGSYAAGGLTPTPAEVDAVAAALDGDSVVPLRVMIRPRGPPVATTADFLYTDDEVRQMRAAIDAVVAGGRLQAARGDGFVFGVLRRHPGPRPGPGPGPGPGSRLVVDVDRCRPLVQAAAPYACVFHRALDLVLAEPTAATAATAALADLRACGFAGVLTAGGPGVRGAVDHVGTLQQLVAAAPPLEIIVGGGVRSHNLGPLAAGVLDPAPWPPPPPPPVAFHASCLRGDGTEAVDGDEVARMRALLA